VASCLEQDAFAEQVEVRAAIAEAFDQLGSGVLSGSDRAGVAALEYFNRRCASRSTMIVA
jgi:hypothetical protein